MGQFIQFTLMSFLCAAVAHAESVSLSVYNEPFAVITQTQSIELKKGENTLRIKDVTLALDPDTVTIQDVKDISALRSIEQSYETPALSTAQLLSKLEGHVVSFLVRSSNGEDKIVKAKVIRSGYRAPSGFNDGGARAGHLFSEVSSQPIVEVDGKLQFVLPGEPQFEGIDPELYSKPSLLLRLYSSVEGRRDIQVSYLTGGFRWTPSYNVFLSDKESTIDLIGQLTIENTSGKNFSEPRLKLISGDVSLVQPRSLRMSIDERLPEQRQPKPAISGRVFNSYFEYPFSPKITLNSEESKQFEFIRAGKLKGDRSYVYGPFALEERYRGYDLVQLRRDASAALKTYKSASIVYEFKNEESTGLGLPLPKGLVHIFRRGTSEEFLGDSILEHSANGDIVQIEIGNEFDIEGERRQSDFKVDSGDHWSSETIEIRLQNNKKESAEVRVIEPLWRGSTYEVIEKSQAFLKRDSQTIEFRSELKPNDKKIITYKVRYSW